VLGRDRSGLIRTPARLPGRCWDYRFGHVVVDRREETRDVIALLPRRLQLVAQRRPLARAEYLEDVLDELPERLFVGTGASSQMRPDPSTLDNLRERRVHVECLPTDGAVVRFGDSIQRGRGGPASDLLIVPETNVKARKPLAMLK
jgi:hypothetical protein